MAQDGRNEKTDPELAKCLGGGSVTEEHAKSRNGIDSSWIGKKMQERTKEHMQHGTLFLCHVSLFELRCGQATRKGEKLSVAEHRAEAAEEQAEHSERS